MLYSLIIYIITKLITFYLHKALNLTLYFQ